MNKIVLSAIPALLLLSACVSEADRHIQAPPETPEVLEIPRLFTIIDFKNKAEGQSMPEWVNHWLEGGERAVEALGIYEGRHVFISQSAGGNFNALTQWAAWFSTELDFPRLAAARIESRFLSGVSHPDHVYGPFFVTLIRAASDAPWTGAVKEDHFWIHRKFYPVEDEYDFPEANDATPLLEEDWKFLILVTIDEALFASQLDAVFRSIQPTPPPTRDQVSAANRVIERFFDGF